VRKRHRLPYGRGSVTQPVAEELRRPPQSRPSGELQRMFEPAMSYGELNALFVTKSH
jgi:hypothetical protein